MNTFDLLEDHLRFKVGVWSLNLVLCKVISCERRTSLLSEGHVVRKYVGLHRVALSPSWSWIFV